MRICFEFARGLIFIFSIPSSDEGEGDDEEAEEVDKRNAEGSDVGEGGGIEHLARRGDLVGGEDPVLHEHLLRPSARVVFHRQGHKHEQRGEPVHSDPDIHHPLSVGKPRSLPQKNIEQHAHDHHGERQARTDVGDGHERSPDFVGEITLLLLHHVSDFVRGDGDARNRRASVGAHGEVHLSLYGIVVVGQPAVHAVDGNAGYAAVAHEAGRSIVTRHAGAVAHLVEGGVRGVYLCACPARKGEEGEQNQ